MIRLFNAVAFKRGSYNAEASVDRRRHQSFLIELFIGSLSTGCIKLVRTSNNPTVNEQEPNETRPRLFNYMLQACCCVRRRTTRARALSWKAESEIFIYLFIYVCVCL